MVVYIAIDKDNGMLFNNRRQSQDRIMRENMLKQVGDAKLWMAEYSQMLFQTQDDNDVPSNLIVDNDFLSKAGPDDHCFVENIDISSWMDKIDTLVIYKWNRDYPDDFYFDFSTLDNHWRKFSVNHFKGSSHDKITKEVWKRI